jgi:hypothetical protein
VAGIPSQENSVSVTSLIFMSAAPSHRAQVTPEYC